MKARMIALMGLVIVLGMALAGCANGSKGVQDEGSKDGRLAYEVYSGEQLESEDIELLGDGSAPEEGWAIADDRLQVQLIAGSIPGISVSDVRFSEGDEVAVTLEAVEGPSTMDIAFFEVVVNVGDREVSSVTLDRGDGSGAVALEKLG